MNKQLFAITILCTALAATSGYIIGSNHEASKQTEVAQMLSASNDMTSTSGVIFYMAKDNNNDKVPSRGDMASFFISPGAAIYGPWIIRLDCWADEKKTAAFLSVADPASLNQPFYTLESSTWPKNAPAYCEYSGTQDGVQFGFGSFYTY